ncbi:MAG: hypothetical protein GF375_01210 [Candidatus Omnitrophica bacterium]|nr:hypothetical protein [Candidatus Omnitrophota bacterium]MBD3268751.1 hypothetical protein [Candidatus Omnitrophota bacterium]
MFMRFLVAFFTIFLMAKIGFGGEVNYIVAKVNNQVITSKDLEDYKKLLSYRLSESERGADLDEEEVAETSLKRLIEDKLILSEAKKEDIEVPGSQVENRFMAMVSSYPSRQDFEESLSEKGLTITLLKEKIREQYLMQKAIDKYVRSQVDISPQDISRYYEENKESMVSSPIYVIYIAKAQDRDFLKSLGELIVEKDIELAKNLYGDILRKVESEEKELRGEFLSVLKNLREKEFTVFEIEGTEYLIYLHAIKEPRPLSLDEVKEDIYRILWNKEFSRLFAEWIRELEKKSVIKVHNDL